MNSVLGEVIENVLLRCFGLIRIFCGKLKVFFVAKAEEVEFVVREHPALGGEFIQLIEVDIKHKDVVMEPMNFWFGSVVHYAGFIEAGIRHHYF